MNFEAKKTYGFRLDNNDTDLFNKIITELNEESIQFTTVKDVLKWLLITAKSNNNLVNACKTEIKELQELTTNKENENTALQNVCNELTEKINLIQKEKERLIFNNKNVNEGINEVKTQKSVNSNQKPVNNSVSVGFFNI